MNTWIVAHYVDVLAWGSLLVAAISVVISLYFGWRALRDAQGLTERLEAARDDLVKQSKHLKTQTDGLEQIRKSLSTRYQGPFPRYLPKVVEVMCHAKKELRIMCSVVSHGNFTEPRQWRKIKEALETARQKQVDIKFITYEDELRRELFRHQYPALVENWEKARASDSLAGSRARELLKRYSKPIETPLAEFLELVDEENKYALRSLFPAHSVLKIEYPLQIYMWVADDTEAVFALAMNTAEGVAQGLYTCDAGVITSLRALFQKMWSGDTTSAG